MIIETKDTAYKVYHTFMIDGQVIATVFVPHWHVGAMSVSMADISVDQLSDIDNANEVLAIVSMIAEAHLHNDYRQRNERGIDYDLVACLENNPQDIFGEDQIVRVLAVREGMNDEENWVWLLELTDNRYIILDGWCDYTGWDCRSGAYYLIGSSPEDAAEKIRADQPDVYETLIAQLNYGKEQTWREQMDVVMEIQNVPVVDIGKGIPF